MRKRRSIDKTPGRSHDATVFSPPVSRLRCTPRRLAGSSCNNSFLDQSLEIVWDNNSPSPTRTLSLGKRKKHHGSDSSSSGGEISDLVQKLADKSGNTPEANPPLLAFWMSRENTTVQVNNDNIAAKGNNPSKQKSKEFQTPSRRPRRVLRKCNKSKMKLLKQDIELLAHPMEKTGKKSKKEMASVLNANLKQVKSKEEESINKEEAPEPEVEKRERQKRKRQADHCAAMRRKNSDLL
ncbi:hypothetical protein OS493_029194 [Desmophyllum pertusum]|uniref:Uncharacterized protein n=1 Tax=Desmophyllum pertusum TaxID=174260 RepID=A0A9X0D715_9CNID|nr:hypothetical protein OS493_029194 [Desmophyllum pertusum]